MSGWTRPGPGAVAAGKGVALAAADPGAAVGVAAAGDDVTGCAVVGGIVGDQISLHANVGRVKFRNAMPKRSRNARPATPQIRRDRLRSRKDAVRGADRRDRRVARLAGVGRLGVVVKKVQASMT